MLKDTLIYNTLLVFGKLLSCFGFTGITLLGKGAGELIWHFVPSRKELAINSVEKHLGVDKNTAEKIAHESFRHNGRSFLELLLTNKINFHPPQVRFDPPELFAELLSTTRPIVGITAHFGAWELLAALLGELYEAPRPRVIVARKYQNEAVQKFIALHREARGAEMIGHRRVALSVMRALHHNGIVAFLVDHNSISDESFFIPFLGEKAAVNMGPAVLGVRTNALIWPIVMIREGSTYVVKLKKPLDTAELPGTRDEKIYSTAEFYTKAIEELIREHPEQWFWMHNRWKTQEQ